MEIKGNIHCFFEQSGTFKNEFKRLGYKAFDYDIQNNFYETDLQIDLFNEIEKGYNNEPSIFDNITQDDLIISFFPCIYFCENNNLYFTLEHNNLKNLNAVEKMEKVTERMSDRMKFYTIFCKMFGVCYKKKLRMIVENPYCSAGFLFYNFQKPTLIDKDRTRRGDFFKKPTAYWFVNCKNTIGYSFQEREQKKAINKLKRGAQAGICSEERSMISSDYARNFICDFILGKEQEYSLKSLF